MAKAPDSARSNPVDQRRSGLTAGLVILAVSLAGLVLSLYATQRWWLPPLAVEEFASTDRLLTLVFILITLVFLGVHLVLGILLMRNAARGKERAAYFHESTKLELTWTIAPAVILVLLTVAGGVLWWGYKVSPAEAAAEPVTVQVTAQQFGWQVHYPGPDGEFGRTSPEFVDAKNPLGLDPDDPKGADDVYAMNRLALPVDRPVHVVLRSKDVIHSFFIPDFRVKQDAVPGRVTDAYFTPTKAGEYELACAELCGAGHYLMRAEVLVMSEEDFQNWLADTKAAALAEAGA